MWNFIEKLFVRKNVPTPENTHDSLLIKIRNIRPDQGMRVFSPHIGKIVLRVPYSNIRDYLRFMENVLISLLKPTGIEVHLFSELPKLVSLSDWFVSKEGRYLVPTDELLSFQDKASQLVEHFRRLESNPSDHSEYQIRIIRPLINQISEITHQFLLVTNKETLIETPVLKGIRSLSDL